MMARYFTRKHPSQWIEDETWGARPFVPTLTVSDHEAADTGLLDVDGNPIFRAANPIGFVWNDE
jgi:hypothetical protein